MSLLDSVIRRLQAQREVLNDAARRTEGLDGIALEFGLGNGRTYDHLRHLMPNRRIVVFDRQVSAHPDCIPPDRDLYLGDLFETLPRAFADLGRTAVLAHLDIGTGDKEQSTALVRRAAPMIAAFMVEGGLLISDQPVDGVPGLAPLALPEGIAPGRIHLLTRV